MSKSLLTLASATILLCHLVSCQKDINYSAKPAGDSTDNSVTEPVDNNLIDTLGIMAMKQVVINDITDPSNSHVYAIQFDHSQNRINVYEDDTTNSNPYDKLLFTYQCNEDGYLISSANALVNPTYQLSIQRDAQNRATKWVTNYEGMSDTTFYLYENIGSDEVVTSRYTSPDERVSSIVTIRYDASRKPLSATRFMTSGTGFDTLMQQFVYSTSNDLLKKITYNSVRHSSDTIEYTYDPAFLGSNAAWALKSAILGKDYYMLNYNSELRQGIGSTRNASEYFLSSVINTDFGDAVAFLGSKPVSDVYCHGNGNEAGGYLTSKSTFKNSYKSNNLISNISVESDSKPYMNITFNYSF